MHVKQVHEQYGCVFVDFWNNSQFFINKFYSQFAWVPLIY